MNELYLRVLTRDDRVDFDEAFAKFLAESPEVTEVRQPSPHGRGGYSLHLAIPTGFEDTVARQLIDFGLLPAI